MQDYLTELEVASIEQFCANKTMYEAVRKVLLSGIYTDGTVQKGVKIPEPTMNGAFLLAGHALNNPIPDEMLGQHIRGMWAGVNALKNAFDKLEDIKTVTPAVESPYNEAI